MTIRPASAADGDGIFALHTTAFDTDAEAHLVANLHQQARPLVSLVAVRGDLLQGHILFTPVSLDDNRDALIMGLAPMAVMPDWQNQGIGSALVTAGLERCRELEYGAVVVLGHPEYYLRFDFRPAADWSIACDYEVPAGVFMARELSPDYLRSRRGTVRYHNAFASL